MTWILCVGAMMMVAGITLIIYSLILEARH